MLDDTDGAARPSLKSLTTKALRAVPRDRVELSTHGFSALKFVRL